MAGPLLAAAVTVFAAAQYAIGRPVAPEAWLAIAPLLASLALRPLRTALVAAWTVLLGLGLALEARGPAGRLASSLAVLALLAGFAVANSVLRSAAQRRLGQARAVARVAQSALLREVPRSVASARLASRYLSASAESQVGGTWSRSSPMALTRGGWSATPGARGCPRSGWPASPRRASGTPALSRACR